MIQEKELIDLWKSRIGKFAKIRKLTSSGQSTLKYGIVKRVIEGSRPIVILVNTSDSSEEHDVPIDDILDAQVENVKEGNDG